MSQVQYNWHLEYRPRGFSQRAPLAFQAFAEIDRSAVQACRDENASIGEPEEYNGFYWRDHIRRYVIDSASRYSYVFDSLIDRMNAEWSDRIEQPGLMTEADAVNYFLAFVHQFPYSYDKRSIGIDEYARFPLETLWDQTGDCECLAILLAALLHRAQVAPVAIVHTRNASLFGRRNGHIAVGAALSPDSSMSGTYFSENGRNYFYCETTGRGWTVGELPPGLHSAQFWVYPVG